MNIYQVSMNRSEILSQEAKSIIWALSRFWLISFVFSSVIHASDIQRAMVQRASTIQLAQQTMQSVQNQIAAILPMVSEVSQCTSLQQSLASISHIRGLLTASMQISSVSNQNLPQQTINRILNLIERVSFLLNVLYAFPQIQLLKEKLTQVQAFITILRDISVGSNDCGPMPFAGALEMGRSPEQQLCDLGRVGLPLMPTPVVAGGHSHCGFQQPFFRQAIVPAVSAEMPIPVAPSLVPFRVPLAVDPRSVYPGEHMLRGTELCSDNTSIWHNNTKTEQGRTNLPVSQLPNMLTVPLIQQNIPAASSHPMLLQHIAGDRGQGNAIASFPGLALDTTASTAPSLPEKALIERSMQNEELSAGITSPQVNAPGTELEGAFLPVSLGLGSSSSANPSRSRKRRKVTKLVKASSRPPAFLSVEQAVAASELSLPPLPLVLPAVSEKRENSSTSRFSMSINQFSLEEQEASSVAESVSREVQKGKYYCCKVCRKNITSVTYLKKHSKVQHNAKVEEHLCGYCDNIFPVGDDAIFTKHLRNCHPEHLYACDMCKGKSSFFKELCQLRRHISSIHKQKISSTQWQGQHESTSSLAPSLSLPDHSCPDIWQDVASLGAQTGLNYRCVQCNRALVSKKSLQRHAHGVHRDDKPPQKYLCAHCSQIFEIGGAKGLFLNHLREEHFNRLFVCSVCSKKRFS